MCKGCWIPESQSIVNEKTMRLAATIHEIYEELGYCTGGPLHVVLDDWNIEDRCIGWCEEDITRCRLQGFLHAPEDEAVFRRCVQELRECTEDERASALAICDQFFDPKTVLQ